MCVLFRSTFHSAANRVTLWIPLVGVGGCVIDTKMPSPHHLSILTVYQATSSAISSPHASTSPLFKKRVQNDTACFSWPQASCSLPLPYMQSSQRVRFSHR